MQAGIGVIETDVVGFECELAAGRHGIAGVQRQVQDRARELVGVDQGGPRVRGEQRGDLDLFAQRRMQQLGGLQDQRIDVDLARLQRLLAGKCQ